MIAGCDGYHGVCRDSIPSGLLRTFEREYPFGWLGILAEVAPSIDELVYAYSERGFALLSLRSPDLSRYYVQVAHDEDVRLWPDDRIWEELQLRTAVDGWALEEGPILEKGGHRHAQLRVRADAARAALPRGRRGPHRAPDRREGPQPRHPRRARRSPRRSSSGTRAATTARCAAYSDTCLRRVWRCEHFSWWMTNMLHLHPEGNAFDRRLQLSQLRHVTTSRAAATALAENYVGVVAV